MKLLSNPISIILNVMLMSRMLLKVYNQVGDFLTFTFYTAHSDIIVENKIETKGSIHMQYYNYDLNKIPDHDEIIKQFRKY